MNCYNHIDRVAVASCSKCGKALCKECADKYTPILCDSCFEKVQKNKLLEAFDIYMQARSYFWKKVLWGVLIMFVSFFVILIIVVLSTDNETVQMLCPFIGPIFCFFSPFGWIHSAPMSDGQYIASTIRMSNGNDGGLESILTFFYYVAKFIIKLVLAIIIGVPKFVKAILDLKKMEKMLASQK